MKTLKTITRERITKTLNRIQEIRSKKTESDEKVVRAHAIHGIKSFCGNSRQIDQDKLVLELTYLENIPKTEQELDTLFERWRKILDRYHSKSDRVFDIQRRYGISGLVDGYTELGEHTLFHPVEDSQLVLTEQDLETLAPHKGRLFSFWHRYCNDNGLTFYKATEESWKKISTDQIRLYLPLFQWARVREYITYSSPGKLKAQGFDQLRRKPKYQDDLKHWEVHLTLGRGLYMEYPDECAWFCACNRIPYR